MSEAGDVIETFTGGARPTEQLLARLSPAQELDIDQALKRDSERHLESSILCFTSGISGLARGFYTWPVVNFYYSVYYATLSIIASNRVFLYRFGRSPLVINHKKMTITKVNAASHDAAIKVFSDNFPNSILLSQDIEQLNPLKWMKSQRELYNYQVPGMVEPDCPDCLMQVKMQGLRRLLNAYMHDTAALAFDRDHSIIAFPLLAIEAVRKEVKGIRLEKAKFCSPLISDEKGQISACVTYFQEMAVA